MRVAFVDQQGDAAGGAEQSLAILLRALPRDVEPHAVLFSDGAFAERLRREGLPVQVVPLPPELLHVTREQPLRGLQALPRAVAATARVLRALRADVVHTNTIKAHAIAAPAARLAGRPCVAHLRDILEGNGRTAVRAVLTACSSQRIAISRAVDDAFALGATRVIPNPLALEDYVRLPECTEARRALGLPEEGVVVVLIGRINRWKGHDRLIRIAQRLRAIPQVSFAIVGAPLFRDADFAEELRAQVAAAGLEGRVRFIPWLDDVRLAYAAADVNVNCSHNEPFGRTIIEAAACAVPSIAFDGGGTADAIRDGTTGRLIPGGDEGAFAAAIASYAGNAELRARDGARALGFAQSFDAAMHGARVADVLREVAA